jgi:hypothetical protein
MNLATYNEYQLEAEYKRWEILLSSIKNENAFLMLQLSEALEATVDKEFVSRAEYFLNEFIAKDECIKDMEKDIRAELKLITNMTDKLPTKALAKHEKLKNEIHYFEKNFLTLKVEFDKIVANV